MSIAGVAIGTGALVLAGSSDRATATGPPCGNGSQSGSTCTYTTVGAPDVFTVPGGVTQISFDVRGGEGGTSVYPAKPSRAAGLGGQATATLSVSPGDVLQIDVGGDGDDGTAASPTGGMMNGPSGGSGATGGYGGAGDSNGGDGGTNSYNGGNGSGGGGASDVRVDSSGCASGGTCGLSLRVVVAGGGGGAGGCGGQGNAKGGAGGDGGGTSGANGGATVDGGNAGVSGAGGTSSAGGAGGLNPGAHLVPPSFWAGFDGTNGASGTGGFGGDGNYAVTAAGAAGGGAGGGYYGGGGGSGGGGDFGGHGGGGGGGAGGAGWVTGSALSSSLTAGVQTGDGSIVVSW